MDGLHCRERLAGYDPKRLAEAVLCPVGVGALANNLVLNLAMSGVHEIRLVDFDTIEASNLTRSPLFPRDSVKGAKPKYKSRVVAAEALRISYAEQPVIRSAVTKYQELGLGFFEGASAILNAADSWEVRADLADISRLLGIPYIEAGFRGSSGQMSVFSNRTPEEPCWRCMHRSTKASAGVGCSLYARQVVSEGRIPATQTVAAFFGALVAEAAIAAVHDEFPLSGQMLTFDLRTGRSVLAKVTTNPRCSGVHTIWRDRIEQSDVQVNEPVSALFTKATPSFREPRLRLRRPFLVAAPCEGCGRSVNIQSPVWRVKEPPRCKSCPTGEPQWRVMPQVLSSISAEDEAAKRPLSRFGLRARDVLEIEDRATGESCIVRLAGSIDELLLTWTREKVAPGGPVQSVGEGSEDTAPEVTGAKNYFFARKA